MPADKQKDEFKVKPEKKHALLKKQLPHLSQHSEVYVWITDALALAKNLATCERFTEARHHIGAACFALNRIADMDRRQGVRLCLKCMNMKMQINIQWAIYGLSLLQSSKDRLCSSTKSGKKHRGRARQQRASTKKSAAVDAATQPSILLFHEISDELQWHVSLITDEYLSSSQDARAVFGIIINSLYQTRNYYIVLGNLNMQVKVVLLISDVFDCFMYYENVVEIQMFIQLQQLNILYEIAFLMSCNLFQSPFVYKIIMLKRALVCSTTLAATVEMRTKELDEFSQKLYNKYEERSMEKVAEFCLMCLQMCNT